MAVDVAAILRSTGRGRLGAAAPAWPATSSARGGRVVSSPHQVLAAVSPVKHPSGVVAIARARPVDVGVVLPRPARRDPARLTRTPRWSSCWPDVQDPGNVGAMVRAAAAFGASGVVAAGRVGQSVRLEGAARRHGRRTAAADRRSVARWPTRSPPPRRVRLALVAAVPRGGRVRLARRRSCRRPTAICCSAAKAPALVRQRRRSPPPQERVTIPMQPPVESLNVAVAGALMVVRSATAARSAPPSDERGNAGRMSGSCSPTSRRP